ncbi:MAG TPA: thioredoxin domain-containing protein [Myxococcaceae bacterium]|nr:thioredoxin domain-containing protein [Myxococcaceae bacterium]
MVRHPRLAVPVGPQDHVLGDATAPLTLLMYGDYTCPYTRRASAFVDVARKKLGRRVRYAFRHFPREELNPDAALFAEAAHAAGTQGRFWEMHRALLIADDDMDPAALAAHLGLDLGRFSSELQARAHRLHVAQEVDGGVRSGVSGTPTLFINGKRHVGSWETGSLLRALGGAPAMARSAHL